MFAYKYRKHYKFHYYFLWGIEMNFKLLSTKRNGLILGGFILVILFSLAILVYINGTKSKPTDEIIEAVENAWKNVNLEEQPAYLKKLSEKASYTLKTVKKEDGRLLIAVTINAPDLNSRLSSLKLTDFPQSKDSNEINNFLCEQIEKSNQKKSETFIYATKLNNEYHISFSNEFVDQMSGGIYSYSQTTLIDMLTSYTEGEIK